MAVKPYVRIAVKSRLDTFNWQFGKALLTSLSEAGNSLLPEYISHNPDKFTELFAGIDESESRWASKAILRGEGSSYDFYQDFAWRRKKTLRHTGYIRHKLINNNAKIVPGALSFRSEFSAQVDWFLLFKKWCELFSPQLAMLHLFSGPELDPTKKNNSFQLGSFNAALKPDVSNAGWAMFYGNEFAKDVDFESISKAGFSIEKIGDGYLVLVTENIQDILNDFPMFSNRRSILKSFFKDDFFLIKEEPAYQ